MGFEASGTRTAAELRIRFSFAIRFSKCLKGRMSNTKNSLLPLNVVLISNCYPEAV